MDSDSGTTVTSSSAPTVAPAPPEVFPLPQTLKSEPVSGPHGSDTEQDDEEVDEEAVRGRGETAGDCGEKMHEVVATVGAPVGPPSVTAEEPSVDPIDRRHLASPTGSGSSSSSSSSNSSSSSSSSNSSSKSSSSDNNSSVGGANSNHHVQQSSQPVSALSSANRQRGDHLHQLMDDVLRRKTLNNNNTLANNNSSSSNKYQNSGNVQMQQRAAGGGKKRSLESMAEMLLQRQQQQGEEAAKQREEEEEEERRRPPSSRRVAATSEEEDHREQQEEGEGQQYRCPICETVSHTQHAFTEHIRSHNAESMAAAMTVPTTMPATAAAAACFSCKICSKVLSSASSLDRHVLVHTGERPFNCKYCALTFTTNGNMHRHMRTHKNPSTGGRDSFESDGAGGGGGVGGAGSDGNGAGSVPRTPTSTSSSGSGGGASGGRNHRKRKEHHHHHQQQQQQREDVKKLVFGDEQRGGPRSDDLPEEDQYGRGGAGEDEEHADLEGVEEEEEDEDYYEPDGGVAVVRGGGASKRKAVSASIDGGRHPPRKVRTTTINNSSTHNNNNNNNSNAQPEEADAGPEGVDGGGQRFCCPVCDRNDFPGMLRLEQHLDREHPSIPAKCRHCDYVFRSHKALNAHRCSSHTGYQSVTPGFRDLTFVDFSSEKFPLIAKNLCERSIRTPVTTPKYECPHCYFAFPCSKTLLMHAAGCRAVAASGEKRRKRSLSDSDSSADDERALSRSSLEEDGEEEKRPGTGGGACDEPSAAVGGPGGDQQQHRKKADGRTTPHADVTASSAAPLLRREDFFANLDLQNRSVGSGGGGGGGTLSEAPTTPSSLDKSFSSSFTPTLAGIKQEPLGSPTGPPSAFGGLYYSPSVGMGHASGGSASSPLYGGHSHLQHHHGHSNLQHDGGKDLADIQSIINVASSGGLFGRQQLEGAAGNQTPLSGLLDVGGSGKDMDLYAHSTGSRDEPEEAQDAFTAEFRRMKLRGQFPCRICTAVFPNLRALKGHNRMHVTAAGPGPYQCNMCTYVVSDKATLIRHMRTHNGDRPYECALCNYAFTTKANCERHLRNRHGRITRDEVKRAIIYHPSEDSSCDDPMKKLQLFNTPPADAHYTGPLHGGTGGGFDDSLPTGLSGKEALPHPRSSTPLSSAQHLKDMLCPQLPLGFPGAAAAGGHPGALLDTAVMLLQTPPSRVTGPTTGIIGAPVDATSAAVAAKIQVKSLEKLNQLTPPQEVDHDEDEDDAEDHDADDDDDGGMPEDDGEEYGARDREDQPQAVERHHPRTNKASYERGVGGAKGLADILSATKPASGGTMEETVAPGPGVVSAGAHRPIDLSMDALDLSKKSRPQPTATTVPPKPPQSTDGEEEPEEDYEDGEEDEDGGGDDEMADQDDGIPPPPASAATSRRRGGGETAYGERQQRQQRHLHKPESGDHEEDLHGGGAGRRTGGPGGEAGGGVPDRASFPLLLGDEQAMPFGGSAKDPAAFFQLQLYQLYNQLHSALPPMPPGAAAYPLQLVAAAAPFLQNPMLAGSAAAMFGDLLVKDFGLGALAPNLAAMAVAGGATGSAAGPGGRNLPHQQQQQPPQQQPLPQHPLLMNPFFASSESPANGGSGGKVLVGDTSHLGMSNAASSGTPPKILTPSSLSPLSTSVGGSGGGGSGRGSSGGGDGNGKESHHNLLQHRQQQHHQHQQPGGGGLSSAVAAAAAAAANFGGAGSGGPVKMIIKNGVLMPKQKQRRYRTERPFACEHCSARFTLRSNMERHIKQQHPQFWSQRQRGGHHLMRRGAGPGAGPGVGTTGSGGGISMTNSGAAAATVGSLAAALQGAFGSAGSVPPLHMPNGAGSNGGAPAAAISEQVKYAILAQQSGKGAGSQMNPLLHNMIVGGGAGQWGGHHHHQHLQQEQQLQQHRGSTDQYGGPRTPGHPLMHSDNGGGAASGRRQGRDGATTTEEEDAELDGRHRQQQQQQYAEGTPLLSQRHRRRRRRLQQDLQDEEMHMHQHEHEHLQQQQRHHHLQEGHELNIGGAYGNEDGEEAPEQTPEMELRPEELEQRENNRADDELLVDGRRKGETAEDGDYDDDDEEGDAQLVIDEEEGDGCGRLEMTTAQDAPAHQEDARNGGSADRHLHGLDSPNRILKQQLEQHRGEKHTPRKEKPEPAEMAAVEMDVADIRQPANKQKQSAHGGASRKSSSVSSSSNSGGAGGSAGNRQHSAPEEGANNSDLVPVAKLVDNATAANPALDNYFSRPEVQVVPLAQDHSDEEGLVASGSASESNNSGTDDPNPSAVALLHQQQKKKSAYSLAPNRVSCPYCQRMFPWSSSLRRHILTHTGQKPFKCSQCTLLFTTKSNCDRHLLRKHGDVQTATSIPVPIDDLLDPKPEPVPVAVAEAMSKKNTGGKGANGASPSSANARRQSVASTGRSPTSPKPPSDAPAPATGGETRYPPKARDDEQQHHRQDVSEEDEQLGAEEGRRPAQDRINSDAGDGAWRQSESESDVEEERENPITAINTSTGSVERRQQEEERCDKDVSGRPYKQSSGTGRAENNADDDEEDRDREEAEADEEDDEEEEGEERTGLAANHPDLPYKCHLCEASTADRVSCLEHMRQVHAHEFATLMTKMSLDAIMSTESEAQTASPDDDESCGNHNNHEQHQPVASPPALGNGGAPKHNNNNNNNNTNNNNINNNNNNNGGKYPDYANRKVICAFCLRRFWSTEDLRRHMRTHSGERPFQCDVCSRRFTLKHSMLRHRKKHAGGGGGGGHGHLQQRRAGGAGCNGGAPGVGTKCAHNLNLSASDLSEDEYYEHYCQQWRRFGIGAPVDTSPVPESECAPRDSNGHVREPCQRIYSSNDSDNDRPASTEIQAAHGLAGPEGRHYYLPPYKGQPAVGRPHQHHSQSELIGDLLGISDQGILSRVLLSSASEAAKLLGVEK